MELRVLKDEIEDKSTPVDPWCKQFRRRCNELRELIADDGEKTRRHFDLVVKQMKAEWNRGFDEVK